MKDFYCNWNSYFCLSLILNNYYDIGCFDYLINYLCFVRNFVNSLVWRSSAVVIFVRCPEVL